MKIHCKILSKFRTPFVLKCREKNIPITYNYSGILHVCFFYDNPKYTNEINTIILNIYETEIIMLS